MTITNAAFDKLLAIYERDRILWAAVHSHNRWDRRSKAFVGGMRILASAHGIDPDQE